MYVMYSDQALLMWPNQKYIHEYRWVGMDIIKVGDDVCRCAMKIFFLSKEQTMYSKSAEDDCCRNSSIKN